MLYGWVNYWKMSKHLTCSALDICMTWLPSHVPATHRPTTLTQELWGSCVRTRHNSRFMRALNKMLGKRMENSCTFNILPFCSKRETTAPKLIHHTLQPLLAETLPLQCAKFSVINKFTPYLAENLKRKHVLQTEPLGLSAELQQQLTMASTCHIPADQAQEFSSKCRRAGQAAPLCFPESILQVLWVTGANRAVAALPALPAWALPGAPWSHWLSIRPAVSSGNPKGCGCFSLLCNCPLFAAQRAFPQDPYNVWLL